MRSKRYLLTSEAGGVFRIPAAFVDRDPRILADETLTDLFAVFIMTHDQLIRRLPGLLPLLDQRERVDVEVFDPGRTYAVAHAWNHEEAHGFAHRLRAGFGDHSLVVVDGDIGRHAVVIPASDEQQLASTREVFAEIRIDGIDRGDFRAVGECDVTIPIQATSLVIPLGVLKHVVPKE